MTWALVWVHLHDRNLQTGAYWSRTQVCFGGPAHVLAANSILTRRRPPPEVIMPEGTGWDIGAAVLYLASDSAR